MHGLARGPWDLALARMLGRPGRWEGGARGGGRGEIGEGGGRGPSWCEDRNLLPPLLPAHAGPAPGPGAGPAWAAVEGAREGRVSRVFEVVMAASYPWGPLALPYMYLYLLPTHSAIPLSHVPWARLAAEVVSPAAAPPATV